MSHAGNIPGLSEPKIEHPHTDAGIEVWAKPSTPPCCQYCNTRKLVIKATRLASTIGPGLPLTSGCRLLSLSMGLGPRYG